MGRTAYQQLWNVVSGAVADAFNRHPDYLTSKGKRSAANSVVKRVTGTVLSFAVQAARVASAADKGDGAQPTSPPKADGFVGVIRTHSYAHVNERCYQAIRRAILPTCARPRDRAGRFVGVIETMSRQLREEMQAKANAPLEEALEAQRIASRFAPEKGRAA